MQYSLVNKQRLHLFLLLLLFPFLLNGSLQAQDSNSEKFAFSTSEQLKNTAYAQKIEQFYFAGRQGNFKGQKDVKINYRVFKQDGEEKDAIVISTGRTEAAMKYQEVVFDLFNNGFSVYIFDHRGQGLSGRMTDDHDMGYVEDFQYYVDDMKTFYDKVVTKDNHKKIYLLSHSMGGTVAMSYLEQYPEDFDAAVFSSPMIGLSAYVCPLAKILSGKIPKYGPGGVGYSDDSTRFESNDVSGCRERYYKKIYLYHMHPKARLGGASVQWAEAACKHMKIVRRNVDKLETPILIFAAENESVVRRKSTEKFAAKAQKLNKVCTLIIIEDAMHEILMEKDPQRNKMLESSLDFYINY